jgi:hypothetical protein
MRTVRDSSTSSDDEPQRNVASCNGTTRSTSIATAQMNVERRTRSDSTRLVLAAFRWFDARRSIERGHDEKIRGKSSALNLFTEIICRSHEQDSSSSLQSSAFTDVSLIKREKHENENENENENEEKNKCKVVARPLLITNGNIRDRWRTGKEERKSKQENIINSRLESIYV